MAKLKICTCVKRTNTQYKRTEIEWEQLAARLAQTTRTAETVQEYRAMSKSEQSEVKDVGGFVLGDLKDGIRGKRTVLSRSAVTLDLDFAPKDFWTDFTPDFGWAAALYSTHKHTDKTPKYRLIVPLCRDVDPEEYEAVSRKLAQAFMDLDWVDDTSFQPSRMMFWPSTSKDGEYVYEIQQGPFLDPDTITALYRNGDWRDISLWPYSSRVQAQRETSPITKLGDPREKKGLVGAFCRAYSVTEAIVTFIPDVYTPTDSPNRWTYTAGSTAGGLVIYDDDTIAYSNHATDPAGGAGGSHGTNAWDIVRIHKFGHLDADAEKSGKKGVNLPSYKAMEELATKDAQVQKAQAESMFHLLTDGMEDDNTGITLEQYQMDNAGWQGQLSRQPKTGKVEETIENVLTILQNDTKLKGFGAYNEFLDIAEKSASLPWWKWNPRQREWTDADTAELYLFLEKYYDMHTERVVKHARNILHQRRSFHPVRDYLDGLKWDGIPRLETLLVDYLNAEDSFYTRGVTRKAITGAVARIYDPGCKMDYVLALTGPQGLGKSRLIRTLASEEWFNDTMDTFNGKEAYEALLGSWFIEIAELAAAKRSDVERMKQFLSKQEDRYRRAYAEKTTRARRQCVFIATTNTSDFLRDLTGNRRWWPIAVRPGAKKDLRELEKDRDQIFAEAKHFFEKGETLYPDPELEKAANAVQEEFTYRSVKFDLIEEFLELELPDGWKDYDLDQRKNWLELRQPEGIAKRQRVCLLEIWQEVFDGDRARFSNLDQREIADILQKLGWNRKTGTSRMGKAYGIQRAYERPQSVNGKSGSDVEDYL